MSSKHIELSKLNHIKIESAILRDRVGEILETFFLQKDKKTNIEEITSLLTNHNVMEETEVERLETFLEIKERLNVTKKKNNRGKRK